MLISRSLEFIMSNEHNKDLVMCDWCGRVTRLEWRDGVGYCRACKRELSVGGSGGDFTHEPPNPPLDEKFIERGCSRH